MISSSPAPFRKYCGGGLPVRVSDVSDAAAAAAAARRGSFSIKSASSLKSASHVGPAPTLRAAQCLQ